MAKQNTDPYEGLPAPDLRREFILSLRTRSPLYLQGHPGTGKTARIKYYCRTLGLRLVTVLLSLRDYQDVMGWPFKSSKTVKIPNMTEELQVMEYAPPAWAITCATSDIPTVLFLDEISNAAPSVQKCGHRLVHELNLGDYLQFDPDRVSVVMAGNPPESGTDASDLSPAMANRVGHLLNVNVDLEDWIKNFPSYWGADASELTLGFGKSRSTGQRGSKVALDLPADKWAHARSIVASYVQRRGMQALYDFPTERAARHGAWPSARTVEAASRILAAVLADGLAPENAIGPLSRFTGAGWAKEFTTFVRNWDLPDPDAILADPEGIDIDKWSRGDQIFCMTESVAGVATATLNAARYKAAWQFCHRISQDGHVDISANAAATLARFIRQPGHRDALKLPALVKYILPYQAMFKEMGYDIGAASIGKK